MKEIADRLGVTVQQFKQVFGNVELFLAGPPVKGFAPNMNALVLPVVEMPSDAAIEAEIGRLASGPPTVRHIKTPVGNAVDMAYSMKAQGRTIHAHSLLLDTQDGVLDLTISALEEATAAALTNMVLETVHRS
jgi:hypothetical protein